MSELPATPASALTRATEQMQGLDLRDDRQSEPGEAPLRAAAAELFLLGELAGQQLSTLGRVDRWRVRKAVRRGRAVDDPRLAAAAVAMAHWQARDAVIVLPVRRRWLLCLGPVCLGVNGLFGVLDSGDLARQVVGAVVLFCAAGWGVSIAQLLTGSPRKATRAERAVDLNRALLLAFSPKGNGSAPDDRPTTLEQPCPEKPDAS